MHLSQKIIRALKKQDVVIQEINGGSIRKVSIPINVSDQDKKIYANIIVTSKIEYPHLSSAPVVKVSAVLYDSKNRMSGLCYDSLENAFGKESINDDIIGFVDTLKSKVIHSSEQIELCKTDYLNAMEQFNTEFCIKE